MILFILKKWSLIELVKQTRAISGSEYGTDLSDSVKNKWNERSERNKTENGMPEGTSTSPI